MGLSSYTSRLEAWLWSRPFHKGRYGPQCLSCPHRAPEHIWVNFWDILRYKPRFFCSLLHAAALGKNLVTLTLQPAGLAFST